MKRIAFTAAATIAAFAAAPAMAQDAGVTVMGNDDAAIGTVLSNDGTTVVLDTGTHEVSLGTEAFGENTGVWSLNMTKAQLDAAWANMLAQQQAALETAMVAGAEVFTADEMLLGAIEEVDETNVTLTHADEPLALPKDNFALNAEGKLVFLATMADVMAALEAQGG